MTYTHRHTSTDTDADTHSYLTWTWTCVCVWGCNFLALILRFTAFATAPGAWSSGYSWRRERPAACDASVCTFYVSQQIGRRFPHILLQHAKLGHKLPPESLQTQAKTAVNRDGDRGRGRGRQREETAQQQSIRDMSYVLLGMLWLLHQ